MKNYYGLTNNEQIEFIGEFDSFTDVWNFTDYELEKEYLWICNEERLKNLADRIHSILNKNLIAS